jgi:muconolactone D-isomerase
MLFLIIDAVKLEFIGPQSAVAQMKMLQQTFNIYKDLKEQGKLKFAYAFADTPGGIMVLDMESNDELQQTLFLLPSMPFVSRTVRPLTEMQSVETLIGELESIVKSMPTIGEKKDIS